MEVFIFEYVTAGGEVPEGIVVEGLGMFKSFYSAFNKISGEISNVNSIVKPDYIPALDLPLKAESLGESFEELAEKSDYTLVIAPEDDDLLLNLTKTVEKRGENLGSASDGVAITSDKWETYRKLKNKVRMPETSEKPLEPPFLLKPRTSCGGEGIEVVKTENEISKYRDFFGKGYVAQEFVEGDSLSVSLMVGDDIRILSVNGQLVESFRYRGAEVPARIDGNLKDIFEEATKAVECVKGLHGYVGVDLILAEVPYVVEINARPTTPCILFESVYGFNLADLILRNHIGAKVDWTQVERVVRDRIEYKQVMILEKVGLDEVKGRELRRELRKIVCFNNYALVSEPLQI